MFRLINHLVQTVRNKPDLKRGGNWNAEYYGTSTCAVMEQQYHPTHATPGALWAASAQRKTCRELKQELRAERRRRKTERVAARRARRSCRRGAPRRQWRDTEVVLASETAPSGSAMVQQHVHEAGGHRHHTDNVRSARSEPVRMEDESAGKYDAPPAYEEVQRTMNF